jgi:mRNA interferase MazF
MQKQNKAATPKVYVKRFNVWTKLKRKVHNYDGPTAHCKPRDVFWVSVGHNVGFEVDGKNDNFERPVLVLRVFSTNLFLGVPLTSQVHDGDYFFSLEYGGIPSVAILSQVRAYSQKRLLNKMGVVPIDMFKSLKRKYVEKVLQME